jgi:hypothetical protein
VMDLFNVTCTSSAKFQQAIWDYSKAYIIQRMTDNVLIPKTFENYHKYIACVGTIIGGQAIGLIEVKDAFLRRIVAKDDVITVRIYPNGPIPKATADELAKSPNPSYSIIAPITPPKSRPTSGLISFSDDSDEEVTVLKEQRSEVTSDSGRQEMDILTLDLCIKTLKENLDEMDRNYQLERQGMQKQIDILCRKRSTMDLVQMTVQSNGKEKKY